MIVINNNFLSSLLLRLRPLLVVAFFILYLQSGEAANGEFVEKLVQEGDVVHIPCAVPSTGSSIQWVRDSKPIKLDFSPTQRRHWNISNDGIASVSINSAALQDAGSWECWHLDQKGNVITKNKVLKLIVTKPPSAPVLFYKNQPVSPYTTLPPYAYPDSDTSSVIEADKTSTTETFGGTLNLREKVMVQMHCVQITWAPPLHAPHWFVGGLNLTDRARLYMKTIAEQIYKVESILSFNVTKEMHRSHVVCETEHLHWPNMQSMATVELNVLYEPSFSISRTPTFGFPISAGMSLSLHCEVDANPPSIVRWVRSQAPNAPESNQMVTSGLGQPMQSDSSSSGRSANDRRHSLASQPIENSAMNSAQLTIKHVSEQNTGWYRCVTDHVFGTFESYGYYLNVRNDDKSKTSEQSSALQANSAEAYGLRASSANSIPRNQRPSHSSASTLHTYYGDQQPQTSSSSAFDSNSVQPSVQVQSESSHSFLNRQLANGRLSAALQPDTPSTASNSNCDTNGRPMVVALNRTVMAHVGQQITVVAVFCCEPRPRKVLWIHRHLALQPATTVLAYTASELYMASNSRNCYRSTFKINGVKREDAGELFFLVSNLKGLDDAFIHINVTGAGYASSASTSDAKLIDFSLIALFVIVNVLTFFRRL